MVMCVVCYPLTGGRDTWSCVPAIFSSEHNKLPLLMHTDTKLAPDDDDETEHVPKSKL